MIKAVLLDLDNTLIHNPDRAFAMAFLRLGESFFQEKLSLSNFHKPLRAAINAMSTLDADPTLLNHTRVVQHLAEAAHTDAATVDAAVDEFYATVFPALRDCIQPVNGAKDLIAHLQAEGYAVVIATNPLYNAHALELRLEWAGLNSDLDHYAFVTHAQNVHTAKPNPAYYAEILARVGIEPDEAAMIGDGQKNDVRPAQQVGMYTYHITDDVSTQSGLLQDFIAQVHEGWLGIYRPNTLNPAQIEPELRGNISALYGMSQTINDRYWSQHPDPDEWSPLQIVCHLYESENTVQRPRLQQIMKEANPFLADPKEPPGPGDFTCGGDGPTYMRLFADARMETIAFLQNISPNDWHRPARHSIFGPTTLLEMAHFTAQHDRLHLNQLCQTLGKCE